MLNRILRSIALAAFLGAQLAPALCGASAAEGASGAHPGAEAHGGHDHAHHDAAGGSVPERGPEPDEASDCHWMPVCGAAAPLASDASAGPAPAIPAQPETGPRQLRSASPAPADPPPPRIA